MKQCRVRASSAALAIGVLSSRVRARRVWGAALAVVSSRPSWSTAALLVADPSASSPAKRSFDLRYNGVITTA